jgi:hypothetical protein
LYKIAWESTLVFTNLSLRNGIIFIKCVKKDSPCMSRVIIFLLHAKNKFYL